MKDIVPAISTKNRMEMNIDILKKTDKCIFLLISLHMSKKSCTFAASKVS